jgi:hypothetical protein
MIPAGLLNILRKSVRTVDQPPVLRGWLAHHFRHAAQIIERTEGFTLRWQRRCSGVGVPIMLTVLACAMALARMIQGAPSSAAARYPWTGPAFP